MKRIEKIMCAVAFVLAIAQPLAQAQEGYSNPVIPGFHPDPSFCAVGGDYYLVCSSFQYFPAVPVFHSRDLVHWEQIGNVLDRPGQVPLRGALSAGGIYAPTIRWNDGVFYMVTTNTSIGRNLVVTAENPAGPWSDPVYIEGFGGIDPSLYFEDGRCYISGSWNDGIFLAELDPSTGKLLSEPRRVWNGDGGRWPEAPHIYRKDGWYYLMISEGGTELAHSVTIARSRDITGPYENNPSNPILTHCRRSQQNNQIQGCGHADLLQAEDGSWWMCFLGYRNQGGPWHLLGRETFLAPVRWDENAWPVVNGDGHVDLEMRCPTLPLHEFASGELGFMGPEWLFIRNPLPGKYVIGERELEICPSPFGLDERVDSPSFLGRRQQHVDFSASARLDFAHMRNGDEAGMSIYMDAGSHYDVFLTRGGGRYFVAARFVLGSIVSVKEAPVPSAKVWLRLEGCTDSYSLLWSSDGSGWNELGRGECRYLSTEAAGGFTGIVLGMYAVSEGSAGFTPARFTDYRYEGR